MPTTPIRFRKPKDYIITKSTECVELVFSSPSKDTTSNISDIINMPSCITPKRKQNESDVDTPRKKRSRQKLYNQQHKI